MQCVFVSLVLASTIAIIVVLEYRGLTLSPDKLLAFPDLLWDLKDLGKLSENIDIAVSLYEFAQYKPGVSSNYLLLMFVL